MHCAGGFRFALAIALAAALLSAPRAAATVVRFQTTSGNIDVRLFDALTPLSIANFQNYVTSNRYDNTFIHRVPQNLPPPQGPGGTANFVVQGGGFRLNNSIFAATGITTDPPIGNEFHISNVRGTLSFAKNSLGATSQWFFNIGDNSFLDAQDFTAFGRVVGSGMTVVDAINNLSVINASVAENGPGEDFDEIPVYNVNKVVQQQDIRDDDAVIVQDVRTLNIPAGDYNLDGRVDGADLTVWKTDFGSTTKAEADGNGNGVVDGADFLVWQRTLGQNFGAPTIAAIPEPAGGALALIGGMALLGRRRRSR